MTGAFEEETTEHFVMPKWELEEKWQRRLMPQWMRRTSVPSHGQMIVDEQHRHARQVMDDGSEVVVKLYKHKTGRSTWRVYINLRAVKIPNDINPKVDFPTMFEAMVQADKVIEKLERYFDGYKEHGLAAG